MAAETAPESPPRCPVLREVDDRLAELQEEILELIHAGDERSLHEPPGKGRWSAAQCVDHLAVSLRAYQPNMERAVERGRARGLTAGAPFAPGTFVGRRLLALLEAPVGRGVPSPRVFRPSREPRSAAELEASFVEAQRRVRSLARAADGLDLGRLRLAIPAVPLLRVSLEQAFRIHVAHEARHRVQAWQALRTAGVAGHDR